MNLVGYFINKHFAYRHHFTLLRVRSKLNMNLGQPGQMSTVYLYNFNDFSSLNTFHECIEVSFQFFDKILNAVNIGKVQGNSDIQLSLDSQINTFSDVSNEITYSEKLRTSTPPPKWVKRQRIHVMHRIQKFHDMVEDVQLYSVVISSKFNARFIK